MMKDDDATAALRADATGGSLVKPPRLRWKREAREKGLRSIIAGPRGYTYHDGEKTYATVSALGGGGSGDVRGWYWVAGWGGTVPRENTCNKPCASPEEAKKQAQRYVQRHLENHKQP